MGKGGRILCIFTPYVLTIASLICLILVGLGCTKSSSNTLNGFYFFRADLQNLTTSSTAQSDISSALSSVGVNIPNDDLTTALNAAQQALNIKDFYDIGLWGYCDGNVSNGNFETSNCSDPKAEFYFNPIDVWKLQDTGVSDLLPSGLSHAISVYKTVSKWMFIAYVIAFAFNVVELFVGLFAICSRWGSCVTSLIAVLAFLFTAAASATSTALFVILTGTFNDYLKDYNIKGSIGKNMFAVTWLAVAFSLAASLFWVLSSCCCSGRSPYDSRNRRNRGIAAEKTYSYEPVTPQAQTANHPPAYGPYPNTSYPPAPPQETRNGAYEPFRHA